MCFSTVEFSCGKAALLRNFVKIQAGAIAKVNEFRSKTSPKGHQKVIKMEGGYLKGGPGTTFGGSRPGWTPGGHNDRISVPKGCPKGAKTTLKWSQNGAKR